MYFYSGGLHVSKRAALLIRCSAEEAEIIKKTASHERRSISGFVLNSVLSRIVTQRRLREKLANSLHAKGDAPGRPGVSESNR
jgi:hypothetical protein